MRSALFVASTGGSAPDASVSQLVTRFCRVQDVFSPSRPPGFEFLIITVDDEDQARKCAKTFNNTIWNGMRLRMELEKDYYLERLKQEWVLAEEKAEEDGDPLQNIEPTMTQFCAPVLRIRKSKHALPMQIICQDQNIDTYSSGYIACGKHTILDPDYEVHEYRSIPDLVQPFHDNGHKRDDVRLGSNTIQIKDTKEIVEGGGVRRGFGTIMRESHDKLESKVAKKKQFSYDYDYDADVKEEGGELPCVSLEETEDTALLKERQRSRDILRTILGVANDEADGSSSAPQAQEIISLSSIAQPVGAQLDQLKGIFHREGAYVRR
jgi:hypothetical protein